MSASFFVMKFMSVRTQLATFLRKSPYNVNLIIGGYEPGKGPSLFFMDYLASLHELPRCAHGYAAHFTLGLLDRFYKKDLSEAEGVEIIHRCIAELETRFLVNRTGFVIKILDKVCSCVSRIIHGCPVGWRESPVKQGAVSMPISVPYIGSAVEIGNIITAYHQPRLRCTFYLNELSTRPGHHERFLS